ncbi:GspE/PulE family protein [Sedimentisphaera salicampi]|uniref:Type II traffic warden ATPase n=1 Tax=Sedimentisphaera salicampi TaxID=1941349 RepID=A0A1W6LJ05_9BACT|nr:ATPase, T2SS/T4P/T4SS family [Sedimentisphaera salicampi]ARN55726.1 Type II traffic warden ATPase [Sedimentisphaera salicampi]
MAEKIKFGQWLVSQGKIGETELAEALDAQPSGKRIGEFLQSRGAFSEKQLTNCLSEYFGIEFMSGDVLSGVDIEIARKLPEMMARRFNAVIVQENPDSISIAIADPLNVVAVDNIKSKLKTNLNLFIACKSDIEKTIELIYHGSDIEEQQLRDIVELEFDSGEEEAEEDTVSDLNVESEAGKAPVIRFVDLMLSQAIKSRASDIHVEPQEKTMQIRMRVDGVLQNMCPPPRKMQPGVLTRLKILSQMNITERRVPQDGRFKVKLAGKAVDVRVSSIPTIYGEKIVMRILDQSSLKHDLASVGFEPNLLKVMKNSLSKPHGIILVTGPTGSGKSTTLYSALSYLFDPSKNITTVEDPVEYRLEGINQVQVKSSIGLSFAACLRSILRQDPDIILLGEIRDNETMEIAVKAALTGHLVLSTLHTNDAPSAVSRLLYMGLEPYLLASAVNLVIAQRLIRRLCERCKEQTELTEEEKEKLQISEEYARQNTFYRAAGCEYCSKTGYRGRLPIFEFLNINSEIKNIIVHNGHEEEVRQSSRKAGFDGLLESGVRRMAVGITTAEEVLAAAYSSL